MSKSYMNPSIGHHLTNVLFYSIDLIHMCEITEKRELLFGYIPDLGIT